MFFLGTTFQFSTFASLCSVVDNFFTVSAVAAAVVAAADDFVVFDDEEGASVKMLHLFIATPMFDSVALECSLRLIYERKQRRE